MLECIDTDMSHEPLCKFLYTHISCILMHESLYIGSNFGGTFWLSYKCLFGLYTVHWMMLFLSKQGINQRWFWNSFGRVEYPREGKKCLKFSNKFTRRDGLKLAALVRGTTIRVTWQSMFKPYVQGMNGHNFPVCLVTLNMTLWPSDALSQPKAKLAWGFSKWR